MARAVQIAPAPHQLGPVELPNDGAEVIETSGAEVLDGASCATANDNAAQQQEQPVKSKPAPAPEVVPFASTLNRI